MRDSISFWDREAASFDSEPDHGLLDRDVREAWRQLMVEHLPPRPARVLDIGCGTGSLGVLLAEEGYSVAGIDTSWAMLRMARAKAANAGVTVDLGCGDAHHPPLRRESFDVVLCRHVLWAMDDVQEVLSDWNRLLGACGVLVLVEGRWSTGAGLAREVVLADLDRLGRSADVVSLAGERLWGRSIDDDRYLVVSPPMGSEPPGL